MGYDEAKIKGEIDAVMQEYRHLSWKERTSFITKAYHDYPNSDVIMYRYMWDIAGDWADNDPKVLLEKKKQKVAPGEMETVILTADMLSACDVGATISFSLEEVKNNG